MNFDPVDLLRIVPPMTYIVVAFWCGWTVRKWSRLAHSAIETAQVALDRLDFLEQAQDYGRDVHTRLARAIEADMVITGGPPKGDPAARRVAAMAMAAGLIEAMRRANLVIEAKEEPE